MIPTLQLRLPLAGLYRDEFRFTRNIKFLLHEDSSRTYVSNAVLFVSHVTFTDVIIQVSLRGMCGDKQSTF